MSCCLTPYNFGCFSSCDSIVLPIVAGYTGDMQIVFKFAGKNYTEIFEVEEGQPVVLPNVFNESAIINFTLIDENGDEIIFTFEEVDYNCFRIELTPTINQGAPVYPKVSVDFIKDAIQAAQDLIDTINGFDSLTCEDLTDCQVITDLQTALGNALACEDLAACQEIIDINTALGYKLECGDLIDCQTIIDINSSLGDKLECADLETCQAIIDIQNEFANYYPASNPDAFISGVTTDGTLDGDGTVLDPLSVIKNAVISKTKTIAVGGWSLVSGLYEYDISDTDIQNDIVMVVPANADFTIISDAELLPENNSGAGTVKIFANNLPTGDFDVTIIIFKV